MPEEAAYKRFERLGEEAYDAMYETRFPAGSWSDIKDYFAAAIIEAEKAGLTAEAKRLEARLEHIRNVYRRQFS